MSSIDTEVSHNLWDESSHIKIPDERNKRKRTQFSNQKMKKG